MWLWREPLKKTDEFPGLSCSEQRFWLFRFSELSLISSHPAYPRLTVFAGAIYTCSGLWKGVIFQRFKNQILSVSPLSLGHTMKGRQAMNRGLYMKKRCILIGMIFLVTGAVGKVTGVDSRALRLWYDQPAASWMTEALPIGNGPMGAMLFGGTDIERIQFNEISLWSGDRMPRPEDIEEENMGAYQAFGDIFIRLGHDPAKVTDYRRELDIDRAIHRVVYEYEGIRYRQTAFASHPAKVIVIHLTADKPAAYTGRLWLTDMHGAQIKLAKNRLSSVGKLDNGFEYEAQVQVLNQAGEVEACCP